MPSTVPIKCRTGAGEPTEAVTFPQISDELTWGVNYRQKRKQAQEINLKPCTAPLMAAGDPHRVTIWRPNSFQNVKVPKLYETKLLAGSKIIDRSALTPKQHINILAEPKKLMFDPGTLKPLRRCPPACTPRVVSLALPKKATILGTWLSFQNTLSSQKIEKLLDLLNTNISMSLPDAETCFKEEEKQAADLKKKCNIKKKKCDNRRKNLEKKWLTLHALDIAYQLSLYLLNDKAKHVNNYEKSFADKLLSNLVDNNFICCKPVRNTKNIFKRGLWEAANKAAVFIYAALTKVELYDFENEIFEPSEPSTVEEEATEEIEEEEFEEDEGEEESLFSTLSILTDLGEEEPEEIPPKPREHGLVRLLAILRQYYSNRTDLHKEKIFSDMALPENTLADIMNDIELIMGRALLSGPLARLQESFEKKITEWVLETDPDQLDEIMFEDIYLLSYELARLVLGDIIGSVCSIDEIQGQMQPQFAEEILNPPPISKLDTCNEQPASAPEITIETVISSSTTIVDEPEEIKRTCSDYEKIRAADLNVKHQLNITPHTPGMVCCASLKVWASWIKEVAENAKMWCLWINQTIKQMRFIASIMRGEVCNSDGTVRKINRCEWNAFVNKLNCDIISWHNYNDHIQDLSEQIIEYFKNKQVACCPLCLEENLNLSEIGIEHLCQQLFEAMQTTQYWRQWLHNMVNEAQTLTSMSTDGNNVDVATIQEITSSTAMLAISGATFVQHRSDSALRQQRSYEPSIYSIEMIDPPYGGTNK